MSSAAIAADLRAASAASTVGWTDSRAARVAAATAESSARSWVVANSAAQRRERVLRGARRDVLRGVAGCLFGRGSERGDRFAHELFGDFARDALGDPRDVLAVRPAAAAGACAATGTGLTNGAGLTGGAGSRPRGAARDRRAVTTGGGLTIVAS